MRSTLVLIRVTIGVLPPNELAPHIEGMVSRERGREGVIVKVSCSGEEYFELGRKQTQSFPTESTCYLGETGKEI